MMTDSFVDQLKASGANKVLLEDGYLETIDPLTVRQTEDGFDASFKSSGVAALMIFTKDGGSQSPKTGYRK